MAQHGATRGVVRDALRLLREEGILNRVQGAGTFALAVPRKDDLTSFQVINQATNAGVWESITRTELLSRTEVATPDAVHARIPDTGGRVLQFEYTAHNDVETLGVSTIYFRYPEATTVSTGPIGSDLGAFYNRVGLIIGASSDTFGASVADEPLAHVLGVAIGLPLIRLERVMYSASGEPFSVGFTRLRGDRMQISMFSASPGYGKS